MEALMEQVAPSSNGAKDWELVDGICEARGEGYAGHRLHLRFRGPQC